MAKMSSNVTPAAGKGVLQTCYCEAKIESRPKSEVLAGRGWSCGKTNCVRKVP